MQIFVLHMSVTVVLRGSVPVLSAIAGTHCRWLFLCGPLMQSQFQGLARRKYRYCRAMWLPQGRLLHFLKSSFCRDPASPGCDSSAWQIPHSMNSLSPSGWISLLASSLCISMFQAVSDNWVTELQQRTSQGNWPLFPSASF